MKTVPLMPLDCPRTEGRGFSFVRGALYAGSGRQVL